MEPISKYINTFNKCDCMQFMANLPKNSVDMTLTDVPYGEVQRPVGTLRQMASLATLGAADLETFSLDDFLPEIYRITKNCICVFCGREQFSTVATFFANKPGTTRTVAWVKTNPVPSNGQYVYLSGIELAIWFKKRGGQHFNAYCKNPVFTYPIPSGTRRLHPTQKHWDLWKELILDNSAENDIIFDPCAGSGVTAWVAAENQRNWICCEYDENFYNKAVENLQKRKILT